jgi:hypothetical protein
MQIGVKFEHWAAQMSWNLKRPAGLQGSKEHPKVSASAQC